MNRAFIRAEAFREANEIWNVEKLLDLNRKHSDEKMIENLVELVVRDKNEGIIAQKAGADMVS